MQAAPHLPVLLDEVLEAVSPAPGRLVVDATFGAGGYSAAFLGAGARVLALDRDPGAVRYAAPLDEIHPDRFQLIRRPFSELEAALSEAGAPMCDAVVFDLGVSSMQIDEADRGFSFMRDGPLDMRMSSEGRSAADLVNTSEPGELVRLFRRYGEEPSARRIAAALVRRRQLEPFTRTLDLADVVEQAVGGRRGAPVHPATRVFQALRIAVNDELDELEAGLPAAERVLAAEGRLAIVSFHSLEDRIAKGFLTQRSGRTPAASRHRPPLAVAAPASFDLPFTKARIAGAAELAANPRSRSAKLRVGVRTEAPAWSTVV